MPKLDNAVHMTITKGIYVIQLKGEENTILHISYNRRLHATLVKSHLTNINNNTREKTLRN